MDAQQVPVPGGSVRIKREQTFFGERRQELDREKRIAQRFFVHQPSKRFGAPTLTMQGVRYEFGNIVARESCENDLAYYSLRPANSIQGLHQGVRRADFIVSKRADDQKMADARVRDDVFEQLEGRSVEPLEIVKKENERVLLISKHTQKGSEYHVKTGLGFHGRKLCNRRLPTDDELEFGDEVHDELPIRANGLADRASPTINLRVIFAQDLASQREYPACIGRTCRR